ncbi:hypothetical protein F0562_012345 [Nyssa sinensis]|uniref:DUF868 domain-containing protein n=1 Tax=Nyssa sinensis TaxID=561372 RepID=A0A5J4ZSF4_9ASTE|nr:hypothetical protein F0562_012345 [Nyssa sinensis]
MEMYSVVNVEKLNLFEPSMLDGEPQETLPSIDDLVVERETSLTEDTILEKKVTTTRHGDRESFRIGRQGAKFGSGPEPQSRFYIAVVVDGEMILVVGDRPDEVYAKTRATKPKKTQTMVLRREHVHGNKVYSTKASFGGKTRDISIDCRVDDDPRLCFSVDHKRVLQIKHLKWEFRGNERVEIDGVHITVSWDVYNWLFKDRHDQDGYALFTFRFEKLGFEDEDELTHNLNDENGMVLWSQQSCGFGFGFEKEKMKKRTTRSATSSSSSLSSASSSCSSVMEWESMEENELKGPSGFSLLIYAWKS